MARNSGGTYSRVQIGGYIAGDDILAAEVNAEMDDITTALTDSLSRSGKGAMTANLDMGGFDITNTNSVFQAGTRLAFAQASAPAGWTQDTSDNADNRMLRVVNTSGGGVAGSHSPILNNVVPSHTHGFTTGGQSADHTHADLGHAHTVPLVNSAVFGAGGGLGAGPGVGISTASGFANLQGASSDHTHTGTTNANGSASNWTPRYIDLIICEKS